MNFWAGNLSVPKRQNVDASTLIYMQGSGGGSPPASIDPGVVQASVPDVSVVQASRALVVPSDYSSVSDG